jgi:homoserine kinase
LRALEQAYSARSADAVKRIFPSVNAKGIEQGFSQMRAQEMQIGNEQITVSGTAATVVCNVRQRFEPKAGKAFETTMTSTFRLQKVGNDWLIVERR